MLLEITAHFLFGLMYLYYLFGADAALLLHRMREQLEILMKVEDETRQYLAEWNELTMRHCVRDGTHGVTAAAVAIEDGMKLLSKQIETMTDPLRLLFEEEGEDSQDETSEKETVDQIVGDIKSIHPTLDFGCPVSPSRQFLAVRNVVYDRYKFQYKPFEWVYEGLDPLILERVLRKRRGTPATIAVLITEIGRRLGIPLLPLPAAPIQAGAATENETMGSPVLDGLSSELMVRINSRTQAIAPGPGGWVVKLLSSSRDGTATSNSPSSTNRTSIDSNDSSSTGELLDTASGDILSVDELRLRYPALHGFSDDIWRREAVLRTWQGLARIAMQAHQRRGEADLVAHWTYVALALDPQAPEWNQVLK